MSASAYDLSGSMGKLGQVDDPEVVKVIEEICTKTIKVGVMLGGFGSPFPVWRRRGLNWTAICGDSRLSIQPRQGLLDEVRKEQGE